MKNILIVEDESLVAMDLSEIISSFGYKVAGIASNFDDALELVFKNSIDLILMDVYLENSKDGISIAKAVKSSLDIPIIYITALNSEEDIKRAVETNPSAYLIKPFDVSSLQAAVEIALINNSDRASEQRRGSIILDEEFSFDKETSQLIRNGEFVKLTKKELELLRILVESMNCIVTFYDIENYIWPDKDFNVNTVRALVSRLRMKLKYKFIETIPSVGYRITV